VENVVVVDEDEIEIAGSIIDIIKLVATAPFRE
jgi:hypothetical protein